jgi:hypothetical protein
MNSTEAKEFLISRIVEEANSENVPLSDLERRMLTFSETYPSAPDMYEIAEQFDKEYDTVEYEAKITELLRNAYRADRKHSTENTQKWGDARTALRREDHYIKVMHGPAIKYARRGRDLMIYVGVGIAVVLFIVLALAWSGIR